MQKIIYLFRVPISKRLLKRFFIDDLRARGQDVECWNLCSFLHSKEVFSNEVEADFVIDVLSKSELRKRILAEKENDTSFAITFNCQWRTLWIYKLLHKLDMHILFFSVGLLPSPINDGGAIMFRVRTAGKLLMHGHITRVLEWPLYKLGYALSGLKDRPYETVFAAGEIAMKRHAGVPRVIPINDHDYDDYLWMDSEESQSHGRTVVFLDQNQGLHPDATMMGRNAVNPESYQRGLNAFFHYIEQRFGCRVIIAAHPTSNYGPQTFHGRDIIKFKTAELVRDSEFVLAHDSTSLCFAVLFQKPVLALYNDEFRALGGSSSLPMIRAFSEALGAPMYNVDRPDEYQDMVIPSADLGKYARYKYDYLTTPQTESRLSKDVFMDFVCNPSSDCSPEEAISHGAFGRG